MRTQMDIFKKTFGILCLLGCLASCQDTMPKRSTIMSGSTVEVPTCAEDEELVTETDSVTKEKTNICKEKPLVRPNNAVFWKPNFCACKDSMPVSYGNCSSFCAGKNTDGAETLFATFTVTEAISLGGLGNMHAWCSVNLPGETVNPKCEIEAKDDEGNVTTLEVNIPANTNSLTAVIQDRLAYDKTYVLTLVESVSKAKSDSIQIVKVSADPSLPILGPLKNAPISQYACMIRMYQPVGNDNYFNSAYRRHYYFNPRVPPEAVPPGTISYACHDIFNPAYGPVDSVMYPRFEHIPGVFNLWDKTDPRFHDNNGDGNMDINTAIVQKTRNFGGTIPADVKFFFPFDIDTGPKLVSDNNDDIKPPTLGFFMVPWVDSNYKSYCLNSTHYNSTNPLFRALKDFIGVDTEGLYMAEKSAEAVLDANGNVTKGQTDLIFIRETDVKAVWFYLNNGVPTVPTDANVNNHAIYFYYPLNKQSPFVRTSSQRIFRVKGNDENSSSSSGELSSTPPHDRKIGCIPKF